MEGSKEVKRVEAGSTDTLAQAILNSKAPDRQGVGVAIGNGRCSQPKIARLSPLP